MFEDHVEIGQVEWWDTYNPSEHHADKLKFIISSTGLSGTRWISQVFTALGLRCGHEFHLCAKYMPRWHPAIVAESSWASAPLLGLFKCPVFHQVRHPLGFINSNTKMVAVTPGDPSKFSQFWSRYCTDLDPSGGIRTAMQIYIQWNLMIEKHAVLRWRLEDLNGEVLSQACHLAGGQQTPDECQQTIARTPPSNSKKKHTYTASDLPDCPELVELQDMAKRYGYEL